MRTRSAVVLLALCVTVFALQNTPAAAQQAPGGGAALLPSSGSANAAGASDAKAAAEAPLPTAAELLSRNDKVMGGREAWNKATTRRMKGLYQTEDNSTFFSIEILQKTPNKSLYKITLPNEMTVRDVCDGRAAWVEDAAGGYHEFSGAALASRLRRSEFLDRGKALLLASTGKVTGIANIGKHTTYVVEYAPEKNIFSRLYFDVDSGYVVHTEDVYTTPDGPYTMKLDMDDYRAVDGLMFPYRMKLTEKGMVLNIRITQASVNVPVDDALFLKPESAPK
jgi:hypothetical protein